MFGKNKLVVANIGDASRTLAPFKSIVNSTLSIKRISAADSRRFCRAIGMMPFLSPAIEYMLASTKILMMRRLLLLKLQLYFYIFLLYFLFGQKVGFFSRNEKVLFSPQYLPSTRKTSSLTPH